MIPETAKNLEVLVADSHAGRLAMSPAGDLSFAYRPDYAGPDLSVCMPFSDVPYRGKRVFSWFDNLLPDNPQVRQGMAVQAGTSTGVFPLLSRFGLDLPGAVQVVPQESLAVLDEQSSSYVQLSSQSIGARLRKLAEDEKRNRAASWTLSDEHWSLGGTQSKLALRLFRGQWYECIGAGASNVIVKPGVLGFENQALIEYATMRLAEACGLPCAQAFLESFDGVEAIVVNRYDRFTSRESGFVTRIHQEDLCQATRTPSSKKYATDGGPTSSQVMQLLRDAEGNSFGRFVDALLFNYLTASTDAHAKNYSLLHPARNRTLLAPLYDVASAAPFMRKGKIYRTAMSIGGENRVGWLRKSSLERFAKTHALDADKLIDRTDELADAIIANLESAFDDLPPREGVDQLVELCCTRITALCRAAQKNIRVDSTRFAPVDITRFYDHNTARP